MYTITPCFPPHVISHLNNIILTALFYASDHKTFGNYSVYKKLIDELNKLSNDGLILRINSKEIKVYFQVVLILGDNLGLNQNLGFVENFAFGRPCRICKVHVNNFAEEITENETLLRTKESYDNDCQNNNPSETGIKEASVFHRISGVHVIENQSIDLMHDLLEGVANCTMVEICNDLIYKQKLITLQFLNDRIKSFICNKDDLSNTIPVIKKEHINPKKKIKMSAAEMLNFSRYFSLLIGDKIPQDNDTWALYILFRKIIAITMSPRYVEGHLISLEMLIAEFLSKYKSLYGSVKYKFHNMTHFVRNMRQNGPLVHTWTMRFESKHRQLKLSAVSTSNRMNLLKTLSLRNQLRLAYMRFTGKVFSDGIIYNAYESINWQHRRMYFPDSKDDETIISTSHAEFRGITYEINMVLVIEMESDKLLFGRIKEIFINGKTVFLLLEPLKPIYFDEHYYAYYVQVANICILKDASKLPDVHSCLSTLKKKRFVCCDKIYFVSYIIVM